MRLLRDLFPQNPGEIPRADVRPYSSVTEGEKHIMFKQTGKSWRRIAALWDGLCALRESGTRWLLGRRAAPQRPRKHRAQLLLEQLETRVVPSNTPPVALVDSYALHGSSLSVNAASG